MTFGPLASKKRPLEIYQHPEYPGGRLVASYIILYRKAVKLEDMQSSSMDSLNGISEDTSFVFSTAAYMIPSVNGSLSAISSMVIMSIILRSSRQSRTSCYHIIMFFMSFWDVIASIAVALNSLPMPSDVHEIYPFASKARGTIGTCSAQGFIIWMGTFFVLSSNCALNVYYVCALRYGIAERTIKKFILPVMFVIAMTVSITVPIAALGMGESENINPHPVANVCLVAVKYPIGCTYNETMNVEMEGRFLDTGISSSMNGSDSNIIECIRGGAPYEEPWKNILRVVGFAFIGVTFIILVVSLFMVIITVFDAELTVWRARRMRTNERDDHGHGHGHAIINSNSRRRDFRRTRVIAFQAMLYIGAFILTWVWLVFRVITSRKGYHEQESLMVLTAFFMPLQGFFNAVIFTYQKTRTLRQVEAHLTCFQAWKQVIMKPSSVPETFISSVEIVDIDVRERRQGEYRYISGSPLRRTGRLSSSMNIENVLNINEEKSDDDIASDVNLNFEMTPFDSNNYISSNNEVSDASINERQQQQQAQAQVEEEDVDATELGHDPSDNVTTDPVHQHGQNDDSSSSSISFIDHSSIPWSVSSNTATWSDNDRVRPTPRSLGHGPNLPRDGEGGHDQNSV